MGVFHFIGSHAGPETSYTDGSISPSSTYIYRVKAVSPTGVSQWSGFVKATTPAPPDPTHTPLTNVIAALPEGSGLVMSWDAPAEDADCVTGHEILRTVSQRDLTALAGGHLQAERKEGVHLELDRPAHAIGTADATTAPAAALHVALESAVQNDLAQICSPRQTGGKS